ncbi:MAG: TorF family putative porin [Alcanivorax sp.]|nr:TorF family putative porin [Alcanivorax sp.]
MKTKSVFKKSIIAAAVAGASFAAPMTASAEISATLEIASQYMFRGLVEDTGNAQVAGSLDYEHDSGVYAGFWTGSLAEGVETNYYAGFASEVGDFSYDVGLIHYRFSDAGQSASDEFASEVYLGLGFMDFGFGAYIGVDKTGTNRSNGEDNKNNYFTLSYDYDKFSFLVGYADMDADDMNYTHIDLGYEIYDGLVFTASQIVDADDGTGLSNNTQFVVSYSFSF